MKKADRENLPQRDDKLIKKLRKELIKPNNKGFKKGKRNHENFRSFNK